jgi:hypothetical protein
MVRSPSASGSARATPVSDTCTRHACHLKATKSERATRDAETRFKNYAVNHAKLANELPQLEGSYRLTAVRESFAIALIERGARSPGRVD